MAIRAWRLTPQGSSPIPEPDSVPALLAVVIYLNSVNNRSFLGCFGALCSRRPTPAKLIYRGGGGGAENAEKRRDYEKGRPRLGFSLGLASRKARAAVRTSPAFFAFWMPLNISWPKKKFLAK
jgi:hypothetical protein